LQTKTIACILPGACERLIELVRQTPSGEVLRQLFPQRWNIWLYLWWKLDYLNLQDSCCLRRSTYHSPLARNWLKVVVKPVLAQKAACSEGRNPQQPMGPSGGMVDAGDSKDPNPQKYMIKY